MDETALPANFGEVLKRRRKELDLTQGELAQRAGCSLAALRKIEAGERRPSKQLAGLLARSLEIPLENQTTFIRVARGELNVERLIHSTHALSGIYGPAIKPSPSPGNLPGMLTPFVGREPELAALSQLLRDPQCRLLTLIGLGGIGKTRLAIEAANHHQDLFPDGVWFVPLAPLTSSNYLVSAIADALNFRFQDPTKPQRQLLNYLHEKRALLVLDNAEHLLDGVGLFAEILKNSPQIKLLVTSREKLSLSSEWVFEIQGLPVPTDDWAEQPEKYSSVALFLQSAGRVQSSIELQNKDRRWVFRICQIMEGLPLGIELAAAWVGLLSCEEIAREIEHNLDFLQISMHDIPERHRSLRATLDHSWNLLSPEEKAILSRLSVFQGSFRREAAEEICGASLAVLSSLKSKSLLRRTVQERYDLHELIRQYAALRLAGDACEDERVKDQYALYYAKRLSNWEKALKSSKQTETLAEMGHEIDNLRQAWQRMVTCCESDCQKNTLFSPRLFHSSLFSLSLFYELRCKNWEAVSLFGKAVESLKNARETLDSLEVKKTFEPVLGHIIAYLGLHNAYILRNQQALALFEEAISLLENSQAKEAKAQTQIMLAWFFQKQGQIQKSANLLELTLIYFRDEGNVWWYVLSLIHLAWAYLSLGKIQESISLYQEGLRLAETGDLRLILPLRNGFAFANYLLNDYGEAERLLNENLELSYQLGYKRQTAVVHLDLGQVALATNRIEMAEKNFQECVNLLSEFGGSHDLAFGLVYSGKCLIARREIEAARIKFLQAIEIGQSLNILYLVYWGLVNLAWVSMEEGYLEKAYETAIVLQKYSVESQVVQDDFIHLLADLQTRLSPQQVDAAVNRTEGMAIESLLDSI